jgi:two-component system phosphate regulon response regulator OmpR
MIADNAEHILIIDDDSRIRKLLERYLNDNGFRTTTAVNAKAARAEMRGIVFDLLILDVMMPGESGFELAENLRSGNNNVPILMLTARSETDQRIKGLELGVDDYLSKPFEPRELLLRINNILGRKAIPAVAGDEVRIGNLVFYTLRGELRKNGKTVKLTERERELMRIFAASPGQTILRQDLVGNESRTGADRAIDVQITRLRRKIEADSANPVYLQTVRGKGYVLHTD